MLNNQEVKDFIKTHRRMITRIARGRGVEFDDVVNDAWLTLATRAGKAWEAGSSIYALRQAKTHRGGAGIPVEEEDAPLLERRVKEVSMWDCDPMLILEALQEAGGIDAATLLRAGVQADWEALDTADAARKLGLSRRRVQQIRKKKLESALIQDELFGGEDVQ